MPWNTNLQGIHLNIAEYNGTPLRVVAGPGTGKTYALMRRVARLLEVEHVQPNRILAVTFTRTAANDLVEKLAQLGVPGADQVVARTLHSLSFSLLSRTAVFQALNRNPRPLMDYERDTLVCDLSRAFGGKREVERFIQAFEGYWARMQHQQPGWPHHPQEQAFHHTLIAWLRFHRAMLVGEVVPLAYDFVTQNPGHPDIPVYQHVLVDEYQDLNRADQALIDAISGPAAVTVIGDEDQSIYGFRHANPEGIVEYPQTHVGTHNELLNECRRCPQRVVEIANALINHNQRLDPKPLNVYPPNGMGQVYVVRHYSVGDEIQTLAAYIDWYLQQHPGMAAGEVLVLANRRMIGNGIRNRLNQIAQQNARPWVAQSFYFEDELETDLAAQGFALLTLLVDPEDRPALRYWLGADANDCRSRPYARLRVRCEQTGQSPHATLTLMAAGNLTVPYCQPLVDRFNLLNQRLATLMVMDVPQLIEELFPAGNEDVATIRQIALTIAAAVIPNVMTPNEFLDELRSAITQPQLPGPQGPAVRIMSLHKSKGLTARLVIIAGCISGIIPSIEHDATPDELHRQEQEQRRLFYVGVTRSTETLVLNSAIRMPFQAALMMRMPIVQRVGQYAILQASPFLAELGAAAPPPIDGNAWRQHLGF
jgi:DNA helicase-2/ATP-dependent DNA helicase PcrA